MYSSAVLPIGLSPESCMGSPSAADTSAASGRPSLPRPTASGAGGGGPVGAMLDGCVGLTHAAQRLAQPAAVELPGLSGGAQRTDMGTQSVVEGEPLAPLARVRELAMPTLLDIASAALEREQLV